MQKRRKKAGTMDNSEKSMEQLQRQLAELKRENEELNSLILQQKKTDDTLQLIVDGTALHTGRDFFRQLTQSRARALQVHYAAIAQIVDLSISRIRTLAVWDGGKFLDNFEYELAGTPLEKVIKGELCIFSDGLRNVLPDVDILKTINAKSYLGIPLLNSSGDIIGHLAVVDEKPMGDLRFKTSIFKIFAARASAEIERLRVEEELAEMALFTQMNPYPVFKLNPKGGIILKNRAAEKFFEEIHCSGKSWKEAVLHFNEEYAKNILAGETSIQLEVQFGERAFLVTYKGLPQKNLILVYCTDITKRKNMEKALKESETRFIQHMREELQFAYEIQLNLLPKTAPQIPGYNISGISIPAQSVGGDYFDYILKIDNRLTVCIGDIAGKGMAASILMANLQATIRGQSRVTDSASECLNLSNTLLYRSTDLSKYATFFYGILDYRTHWFSYSNAGHNPPIFFPSSGDVCYLKTGGTVLGFLEQASYKEDKIFFNPGDLLLLYSDGIIDSRNSKNEEYGEERLLTIIAKNKNLSSEEIIDRAVQDIINFSCDSPQFDDMTLVVVKRLN